jgi:hypothetical protein
MFPRHWLSLIFVLSLATPLYAKQGVVHTIDGRALQGDIDEDQPDGLSVAITARGATIVVERSNIDSIDYVDSSEDAFDNRLDKLAPADFKGRLDLANFELEHDQFEFARRAALSVQKVDPQNQDAALLLQMIQSQQILLAKQAANPGNSAHSPAPKPTSHQAPAIRVLTSDDINRLRQYELRSDDTVGVEFLHDVRRHYLTLPGADPDEFNAATPVGQAMSILRTADPDLAHNVRITNDPRAFSTFHLRIAPRLIAGCAASGCHSSEGYGGLYLYNDVKQAAWYTDFYILQSYSKKIEVSDLMGEGKAVRPMIDRIHPESSLLLQLGLPRNLSDFPHPDVRDWKPIFRNKSDPFYIETVDWIGNELKPFQPAEYGITFRIPHGPPSQTPAPPGNPSPEAPTNLPTLPPPTIPAPPPPVTISPPAIVSPPVIAPPTTAPIQTTAPPTTAPSTQLAPVNKG